MDTGQPLFTAAETVQVRRLLRRLGAANPLRLCALALLEKEPPAADALQVLLSALAYPADWRWEERVIAAWALGYVECGGDRAFCIDRLCDVLDNRQEKLGQRLERATRRSLLGTPALAAMLTFVMGLYYCLPLSNPFSPLLSSSFSTLLRHAVATLVAGIGIATLFSPPLFLCVLPLCFAGQTRHNSRVRAAAAATLGRMRTPVSVAALAGAVFDSNAAVRRAATAALPDVLATLSPNHYNQLDARAVPNLCRLLNLAEENLVLAALEALSKVGDGRAVAPVERVAKLGRTDRLREAAERLLPLLRERRQQENAPRMLLRTASAADVSLHVLLRSTENTEVGDQQALLRSYSNAPQD